MQQLGVSGADIIKRKLQNLVQLVLRPPNKYSSTLCCVKLGGEICIHSTLLAITFC